MALVLEREEYPCYKTLQVIYMPVNNFPLADIQVFLNFDKGQALVQVGGLLSG